MDEARQASTDQAIPDFSGLVALELPTTPKFERSERPLRGWQRSVWWPLLLCVAALQLLAIPYGPLAPFAIGYWGWIIAFYMCAYSIVPAQICLLNLGLVLGPGPLSRRAFVYWIANLLMLACWYLWLWLAEWASVTFLQVDEYMMPGFAEMGIWLPLFMLTLQLPLWGLRCWYRDGLCNSRLGKEKGIPPQKNALQFSIRDLMFAMALFAITTFCYRWLWIWQSELADPTRGWVGLWLRTAGIAIAFVPPIVAWLSMRRFSYLLAWILTLVYATLLVSIGAAIYAHVEHFDLSWAEWSVILPMTAGFAIPLLCGVNLLRLYGWRLERKELARRV